MVDKPVDKQMVVKWLLIGWSPVPVTVANGGLGWDPLQM